ncbi:MAG: 23S rRNA (uracil(1939)-C(5))-methyltransferase RlmD [Rhabdochlamydiaceae bacterium]|nr:23S rRNA (uracil(1939)-C(5))-methyltransferase RlmD [Rhabdochlamydiaceae bacterium]
MTLCSIHSVAFGGDGVGKIGTQVCFVPFTLPGEVAEIEISEQKRHFAKGKLKKLIQVNPERVNPPCPYFFQCGGCQLQHAAYPLQLELKKRFLEDSLTRIAKIQYPIPPIKPSTLAFEYRRHISLKIQQINQTFSLGFTTKKGAHLPIQSCLLFHKGPDPLLIFLQKLVATLDPTLTLSNSSLKIVKTSEDRYIIFCHFLTELPDKEMQKLKDALTNHPAFDGWIIQTPKKIFTFGETTASFTHRGITCTFSPLGFVQNHPEQTGYLYDWVLEKNQNSQKILDLYCGIGASSLLFARDGKIVTGVELNPASIKLAIQNGQQNQIKNVQFLCADVEEALPSLLASFTPDSILVNPPKVGLAPAVLKILGDSKSNITYVSCNPPTLARDLAYLSKQGFILKDLQAFDMFPQTTHLETAVYLVHSNTN